MDKKRIERFNALSSTEYFDKFLPNLQAIANNRLLLTPVSLKQHLVLPRLAIVNPTMLPASLKTHQPTNQAIANETTAEPPSANSESSTEPCFYIRTSEASEMSRMDLNKCLDMIQETSGKDYMASSTGWSRRNKMQEMKLPDLRYILLDDARHGQILGFLSFMLTYEDGLEVVYLYEIHLHTALRGHGVGAALMQMFERVGQIAGVEKAMLTVFRANKAVEFYHRLGYMIDEYSPEPRILRGVVKEVDYLILSKQLG